MGNYLLRLREQLTDQWSDPLARNSIYILLSRMLNVGCGFFFWLLAARFYPIEEVGICAALVSSLDLVILFSRLGMDYSTIRFLPTDENRSLLFNTSLLLVAAAAVLAATVFIAAAPLFSPQLIFLRRPVLGLLFIGFALVYAVSFITGTTCVALREGRNYLLQNVCLQTRLLTLFLLRPFGSFGLFAALGLGYALAAGFALVCMARHVRFQLAADRSTLSRVFGFSARNYIAELLLVAPSPLLALLVLNHLGKAAAAQYHIAYSLGNLVLFIPDALTTSLFVEGSHGEHLPRLLQKTIKGLMAAMVPTVLFLLLLGGPLLNLFGRDYGAAVGLLRLFALSGFFISFFYLFITVQNIRMAVNSIVLVNLCRFVLLLALGRVLIPTGITGAGIAWMAASIVLAAVIAIYAYREKLLWE